jgi:hypothetical protein
MQRKDDKQIEGRKREPKRSVPMRGAGVLAASALAALGTGGVAQANPGHGNGSPDEQGSAHAASPVQDQQNGNSQGAESHAWSEDQSSSADTQVSAGAGGHESAATKARGHQSAKANVEGSAETSGHEWAKPEESAGSHVESSGSTEIGSGGSAHARGHLRRAESGFSGKSGREVRLVIHGFRREGTEAQTVITIPSPFCRMTGWAHFDKHGMAHGEFGSHAHGEFENHAHGEFENHAHGELQGNAHGELQGNAHGEFDGNTHGQLQGNTHGQLQGNAHGEDQERGQVQGQVQVPTASPEQGVQSPQQGNQSPQQGTQSPNVVGQSPEITEQVRGGRVHTQPVVLQTEQTGVAGATQGSSPEEQAAQAGAPGSSLPFTGSQAGLVAALGALMLMAGIVARRRVA